MEKSPTKKIYSDLQRAFDYFNKNLFNNKLNQCVIILKKAGKKTLGYWHKSQWSENKHDKFGIDEICLNPIYFLNRTTAETLSTLVHEMVHLWQDQFGTRRKVGIIIRNGLKKWKY